MKNQLVFYEEESKISSSSIYNKINNKIRNVMDKLLKNHPITSFIVLFMFMPLIILIAVSICTMIAVLPFYFLLC